MQVGIKIDPADKRILAERAGKAGLTLGEYLMAVMHRDSVDSEGCPTWARKAQHEELMLLAG